MKERPILFSAPMVRAILAGTKTQTRRAVKHPALATLSFVVDCGEGWWGDEEGAVQVCCPYGQPGDRLWARETFYYDQEDAELLYRADGEFDSEQVDSGYKWQSSIHMPRWASRITLEITGVRVERLQDISEGDAKAEGVIRPRPLVDDDPCTHIDAFGDLWESINGPGSWDKNPWVWVVEFRRVTK